MASCYEESSCVQSLPGLHTLLLCIRFGPTHQSPWKSQSGRIGRLTCPLLESGLSTFEGCVGKILFYHLWCTCFMDKQRNSKAVSLMAQQKQFITSEEQECEMFAVPRQNPAVQILLSGATGRQRKSKLNLREKAFESWFKGASTPWTL